MEIVILIIALMIMAVWGGLTFWSKLGRLNFTDFRTTIEYELNQHGLQLVQLRDPSMKELMTSPFGWVEPALNVGGMSVTLHEKITKKVVFQNRHGVTGENWLQIRRNRWNGEVTVRWEPEPAHFQHLKTESRF